MYLRPFCLGSTWLHTLLHHTYSEPASIGPSLKVPVEAKRMWFSQQKRAETEAVTLQKTTSFVESYLGSIVWSFSDKEQNLLTREVCIGGEKTAQL